MSQITISHLNFTYEGAYDPVFEDVSLVLDTDWRLGLTGRNGRGKTTLLRLLSGELDARGAIRSAVPMRYFPFPVDSPDDDTRGVLARLLPDCPEWRILRELTLLGVDENVLYRPFSTMSNGEQTKVLLASLFLHEGEFFLIDEPTNHLDAEGRRALGAYLAGKKGYLLVSHDRDLLDRCCDHMLALNRQNITVTRGGFTEWERDKRRRDEWERAENERLERDIARLDAAARRTERWSGRAEKEKFAKNSGLSPDRGYAGHKAAKLMKRAKVTEARRQAAAEERRALLRNVDEADALCVRPLAWGKSGPLLRAEGLRLFYGGAPACEEISLTLRAGERVAVTGGNGCGKSTFLKKLCGQDIAGSGMLDIGAGLVLSYVPQDASFLRGSPRDYAAAAGVEPARYLTLLRKLGFERAQFDKDMADFSAGQKKKALLARSLCERAHLYLWDEPLNYIDVLSRMQIEQLLTDCAPTMLFVEHDAAYVRRVATRTIRLEKEEDAE